MLIDNINSHQKPPKSIDQQIQSLSIKKKSLIHKKKKLPHQTKLLQNPTVKHVVNIGDICFMNEDALRNPQTTNESLLTSVYHYNTTPKVSFNESFVSIELKRNYKNFLPPEYFIERLRSFGDRQMANMAHNLQKIHHQFSMIKDACPTVQNLFTREKQEMMLKKFIANREGKKYFLFFSEISPQKITMKNIIFSVPLLEALGCDVNNISADFIKYKHVFFEVFTAKNYGYFAQGCFQKFVKIQAQIMENPDMDEEERRELTEMIYEEQVIRKIPQQNTEYEQVIPAKVAWFTPHPSICCFEILDINETDVVRKSKQIKLNEFKEQNSDENLRLFDKLGINHPILQHNELGINHPISEHKQIGKKSVKWGTKEKKIQNKLLEGKMKTF